MLKRGDSDGEYIFGPQNVVSVQSARLGKSLKDVLDSYGPFTRHDGNKMHYKKLNIDLMQVFFTSSVNGMRILIKTSLGPTTVFLYPVKKFSSSFTFLVFPSIAKKKENEKGNNQISVNNV